ncbi:hypothetical protein, partial [Mesorhizobium japonicum]|uniref:hypothetical protein n=1 Tax=Mesorhizobium japonicum TaxID=2066070 RepID=UPI003B5C530C
MQTIMVHLNYLSNDLFAQMNKKSAEARDAQEHANTMESVIAKLEGDKSKLPVPWDVIAYGINNKIT